MVDNEVNATPATNATTSPGPSTGPAAGPLVVAEANPRYFAVASDDAANRRVVYLTGPHVTNRTE